MLEALSRFIFISPSAWTDLVDGIDRSSSRSTMN
jgi:hypothetical protein